MPGAGEVVEFVFWKWLVFAEHNARLYFWYFDLGEAVWSQNWGGPSVGFAPLSVYSLLVVSRCIQWEDVWVGALV